MLLMLALGVFHFIYIPCEEVAQVWRQILRCAQSKKQQSEHQPKQVVEQVPKKSNITRDCRK